MAMHYQTVPLYDPLRHLSRFNQHLDCFTKAHVICQDPVEALWHNPTIQRSPFNRRGQDAAEAASPMPAAATRSTAILCRMHALKKSIWSAFVRDDCFCWHDHEAVGLASGLHGLTHLHLVLSQLAACELCWLFRYFSRYGSRQPAPANAAVKDVCGRAGLLRLPLLLRLFDSAWHRACCICAQDKKQRIACHGHHVKQAQQSS